MRWLLCPWTENLSACTWFLLHRSALTAFAGYRQFRGVACILRLLSQPIDALTARILASCQQRVCACQYAIPAEGSTKRDVGLILLYVVLQFRPEKDHALQLRAFARARMQAASLSPQASSAVQAASLKLAGSCRGSADEARVEGLRRLCHQLGLANCVEFCLNVPFADLERMLGEAVGCLHTMVDEHFGISIVECMAAGVLQPNFKCTKGSRKCWFPGSVIYLTCCLGGCASAALRLYVGSFLALRALITRCIATQILIEHCHISMQASSQLRTTLVARVMT